jgi:hypothetical protein
MSLGFEEYRFVGLTPYRGENHFASTFEGFVPIMEREYDLIRSANRSFTKFVSRAMLIYYCTQHIYGHLTAVKRKED